MFSFFKKKKKLINIPNKIARKLFLLNDYDSLIKKMDNYKYKKRFPFMYSTIVEERNNLSVNEDAYGPEIYHDIPRHHKYCIDCEFVKDTETSHFCSLYADDDIADVRAKMCKGLEFKQKGNNRVHL